MEISLSEPLTSRTDRLFTCNTCVSTSFTAVSLLSCLLAALSLGRMLVQGAG